MNNGLLELICIITVGYRVYERRGQNALLVKKQCVAKKQHCVGLGFDFKILIFF